MAYTAKDVGIIPTICGGDSLNHAIQAIRRNIHAAVPAINVSQNLQTLITNTLAAGDTTNALYNYLTDNSITTIGDITDDLWQTLLTGLLVEQSYWANYDKRIQGSFILRGTLTTTMSAGGTADCDIAGTTPTLNFLVYDWLLTGSQTIANGTKVFIGLDWMTGFFYVIDASCP